MTVDFKYLCLIFIGLLIFNLLTSIFEYKGTLFYTLRGANNKGGAACPTLS